MVAGGTGPARGGQAQTTAAQLICATSRTVASKRRPTSFTALSYELAPKFVLATLSPYCVPISRRERNKDSVTGFRRVCQCFSGHAFCQQSTNRTTPDSSRVSPFESFNPDADSWRMSTEGGSHLSDRAFTWSSPKVPDVRVRTGHFKWVGPIGFFVGTMGVWMSAR